MGKLAFGDMTKSKAGRKRGKIIHEWIVSGKKVFIYGVKESITIQFIDEKTADAFIGYAEKPNDEDKRHLKEVTQTGKISNRDIKIFKKKSGMGGVYKISDLSKTPEFGGGKSNVSASEKTQMQEVSTTLILKQAIVKNKSITTVKELLNDPYTVKGLNKIWHKGGKPVLFFTPNISKDSEEWDWAETFVKQNLAMLKRFGKDPKWDVFNRGGGFMQWITDHLRTHHKISKKDTWNPADIWLYQRNKLKGYQKKIEEECGTISKTANLTKLNEIMRGYFKDEVLVGISLKKVSLGEAYYEEANTDAFFKNLMQKDGDYSYKLSKINFNLKVKDGGKDFETQDLTITLKGGLQDLFRIQIKGNESTKWSNMKYEPTDLKFTKARLGKVPLDLLRLLSKAGDVKTKKLIPQEHKKHPKSLSEYEKKSQTYKDYFGFIMNHPKVENSTKLKSVDQFHNNMKSVFDGGIAEHVANAKLQELEWLNYLLKLKDDQMDDFLTDMIFLSSKKGEGIKGKEFGPFGKLY